MKLVIAIVHDEDVNKLIARYTESDIMATRLASTGGFLKAGNTTIISGVEDDQVDKVLDIISSVCKKRKETVTNLPFTGDGTSGYLAMPLEITIGGATVFVLEVDQFLKI